MLGASQTGDPCNQPQKIEGSGSESMADYKIPSRAEHNALIRRIWKHCMIAACLIFLVTGGTVLGLFLAGFDSKSIINVSTAVFQVIVLSYGMGFFVPSFLTSLIKMHLGIEMSRMSAGVLEKIDKSIDDRLKRVDKLLDSAENSESHPLVKKAEQLALDIKGEVANLRGEVKRVADAYTKPLIPPPKKVENASGPADKTNGSSAQGADPVLRH